MMAKIDNIGPFQFFFTLSCADKLWSENVTAILQERHIKVYYGFDASGEEETLVGVKSDDEYKWIPLEDYVENYMDDTVHETLRRNVVTATRNYNHRVKSFIKEIMTDKSNPMLVEYYSAKVEFQGRGAAHTHGTIWVNMDDMEFMFETDRNAETSQLVYYDLEKIDTLFKGFNLASKQSLKDAILICKDDVGPKTLQKTTEREKAIEMVMNFGHKAMFLDRDEYSEIIDRFPFVGLKTAFKKFQTNEDLTEMGKKQC